MQKSSSQQRKNDAFLFLLLGAIVALVLFIQGGPIIRIYLTAAMGVVVVAFLVYKIVNFVTSSSKGSSFAYYWNEIVYSIIGIPIIVIATFYLPVAIYILFFTEMSAKYKDYLKWIVIGVTVVMQAVSLAIMIKRSRKEKKITKEGQELLNGMQRKDKNKRDFETLLDMKEEE